MSEISLCKQCWPCLVSENPDDDDDDDDDDDVNDHDDDDGDGGGHLAASSPVTHCRETEQKWRGMLNIIFIKIQIFI